MSRPQVKVNAMSYAIMLRNMVDGVFTCRELAEITGLNVLTVYQYTREMHKQGAVHIAHYEPDSRGRHNIKVFRLGVGQDAKRPKMTGAQKQVRRRAKIAAGHLLSVLGGRGEYVKRANGRTKFQPVEVAA